MCLVLLGSHVAFFSHLNLCLIKQCSRWPVAGAYSYNVYSTFMFLPIYLISHQETLFSWHKFLLRVHTTCLLRDNNVSSLWDGKESKNSFVFPFSQNLSAEWDSCLEPLVEECQQLRPPHQGTWTHVHIFFILHSPPTWFSLSTLYFLLFCHWV